MCGLQIGVSAHSVSVSTQRQGSEAPDMPSDPHLEGQTRILTSIPLLKI